MSLVESNRKKAKTIDRGHDIKPAETFSIDELKSEKSKNKAVAEVSSKPSNVDRVTFYANVRINNHIKNKLEALSTIGLAKSQKDALESALDYYIESLPDDYKRKFKIQVTTLEERDVIQKHK